MYLNSFDLGIDDLTLEPGESYTFNVHYEPENTVLRYLVWFSTDSSVVEITPETNTVTAVNPGNAMIFAESLDGSKFDECSITVNGSAEMKAADRESDFVFFSTFCGEFTKN